MMTKVRRALAPIGILAAGALLMIAFLGMREEQQRRPVQPRVRIVDASAVSHGSVQASIVAFGTVLSTQPIRLNAEVEGKLKAGSVPFQPAQTFDRGDVLVRIDDRQIRLERNSTVSDLMNALAVVLPEIKADYPGEYTRWQDYFDRLGFEPPVADLPEVANRRVKLLLSRAGVFKLQFRIRNLEIELEKYTVRAPFGGAIVASDQRVGATVRPGTRLGTIINLESLEVEVPLATPDLPWVDLEGEVVFDSDQIDGRWRGRITRIGRAVDAETQTVPVYVRLDLPHAGALPEGVFVAADIPGRVVKDAIEIPRRAIYDERYVYVVENGQLEYRRVEIVRRQPETVIVNGGLADGDTLVIEALQGVAPGMLAQARLAEAAFRSD
jgi:multidrug efflux pump subunit AcrA (membrane-fusion protein)